jgi:hypothetical protein
LELPTGRIFPGLNTLNMPDNSEYAGQHFRDRHNKLACVEAVSKVSLEKPSEKQFTCHYVNPTPSENRLTWPTDARFSLTRVELESLLYESVKAPPGGKIGLRVRKRFESDGRPYIGKIVCGRKGSVAGELWWTVRY